MLQLTGLTVLSQVCFWLFIFRYGGTQLGSPSEGVSLITHMSSKNWRASSAGSGLVPGEIWIHVYAWQACCQTPATLGGGGAGGGELCQMLAKVEHQRQSSQMHCIGGWGTMQ